jgi:hypothetical protein
VVTLANAVLSLYEDSSVRSRLSARGLAVAEKFTAEALFSRLTGAFRDILRREKTSH